MYAIIETGGKQYRVENGDVIYVEKLNAEVDEEITFDKVVAVSNRTLKLPNISGSTRAPAAKPGKTAMNIHSPLISITARYVRIATPTPSACTTGKTAYARSAKS